MLILQCYIWLDRVNKFLRGIMKIGLNFWYATVISRTIYTHKNFFLFITVIHKLYVLMSTLFYMAMTLTLLELKACPVDYTYLHVDIRGWFSFLHILQRIVLATPTWFEGFLLS